MRGDGDGGGQMARNGDTRTRILASARKLFARDGYESTSVRVIAAGAGVSDPALYHHFHSKRDILRALLEPDAPPATPGPPGRAGTVEAVTEFLLVPSENPDLVRITYSRLFADDSDAVEIFAQRVEGFVEHIEQILIPLYGDRSALIARTLCTSMAGSMLDHLVDCGEGFSAYACAEAIREEIRGLVELALPIEATA